MENNTGWIRSKCLLRPACLLILVVSGCTQNRIVQAQPPGGPVTFRHGSHVPRGARLAVQFNNEPHVTQVSDGRGGPRFTYRGKEVTYDRIRSVRSLKAQEARERFNDTTLVGAVLIELDERGTREASASSCSSLRRHVLTGALLGATLGIAVRSRYAHVDHFSDLYSDVVLMGGTLGAAAGYLVCRLRS